MNSVPLPRWARISIAASCAGIGLASSTVNGWLLVRGLELTEPDASSRAILIASSVLMITVELVAFFLTALLPAARLRQLRIMGIALWLFGVVTIFGTRLVLNHNADAAVTAHDTRVENLRLAIASRESDAARVRANGERQNSSDHAWTRHLGALAIKQADTMERDIEPLRNELAELQASQRTTMPRVLGPELALAQSVAMPVLISTIGLTLFGVAGLMLRRTETQGAPARRSDEPEQPPYRERVAPEHRTAVPRGAAPAVPRASGAFPSWHPITVAVPLAAASVVPAAVAAPVAGTQEQAQEPTPEQAVAAVPGDRYQRLRAAVMAGEVKPSVRAIRDAGYGGTATVQQHIRRLAAEGVIVKSGPGYTRAPQGSGSSE